MQGQISFIHQDTSAGQSLVRLVESAGLKARRYRSIDEFLAEANLEEAACVVLDDLLFANVDTGLLAAREQCEPHPFPIILLSMSDEGPARQRARDMGASAFFREPVDGEALLDAIRWAVDEPMCPKRPQRRDTDTSNTP